MSKRELIVEAVDRLPDPALDRLLSFVRGLQQDHGDASIPTLAAESVLAKDWLSPEEDVAWADL